MDRSPRRPGERVIAELLTVRISCCKLLVGPSGQKVTGGADDILACKYNQAFRKNRQGGVAIGLLQLCRFELVANLNIVCATWRAA